MDRLSGRTAITTECGVHIGRASAIRMAEAAARIAIFDVLEKEGIGPATELASRGLEAGLSKVDVSDLGSAKPVIDAAASHFGRLDMLLNNGGISGSPAPTDQVMEAEWDRV
jgi:NAD(P)-dependent dehydrogenase (short-subunit alcohol dehydrogenase family)